MILLRKQVIFAKIFVHNNLSDVISTLVRLNSSQTDIEKKKMKLESAFFHTLFLLFCRFYFKIVYFVYFCKKMV